MIEITCPKCGKKFKKADNDKHSIVHCPYCFASMTLKQQQQNNSSFVLQKKSQKSRIWNKKRLIYVVIALVVVIASLVLIWGKLQKSAGITAPKLNADGTVQNVDETTKTPSETNGTIGHYIVTVADKTVVKNSYDNSDVLLVTYKFTNNSDRSVSWAWAIDDTLFQNGIEDKFVYTNFGLKDKYDPDNTSREIQPGVTLDVQCAYELIDTETTVEVEIKEAFSWTDEKITYKIEL